MLKPDTWIHRKALEELMIEPFEEALVRGGAISYGLSSYGYDLRLADEFQTRIGAAGLTDPKNMHPAEFSQSHGSSFVLPANSYCLGRSLEYFRIPRDVTAIVQGKSTYARCGVFINVTPLEAGWEGHITMSIANLSAHPVKLYAGEGIAQALFFESDPCRTSYGDRAGKYQAQQGITLPRV